jgi:Ca2+-binding EF-hand superfamily protein
MKKLSFSVAVAVVGASLVSGGAALACGKDGGGHQRQGFSDLDQNQDGQVTLAELTQKKEGWLKKLDGNRDGAVTQAELEAAHTARKTERVTRLFTERDANKDGKLTVQEANMPPRRFQKIDQNSDGSLTKQEMLSRGNHEGRAGRAGKGGFMAHLDQNADGKITVDEVRAAAKSQLARLDKNSDGVIQADEMQHRGGKGKHRCQGKHRGPGKARGKAQKS